MEAAHASNVEEVLDHLKVDINQGLTAIQVSQARLRYGRNELAPEPVTPFWKLVLKQFDELLVKILIVAAVVDFIIALANGEHGIGAFIEPAVIVLILLANAAVGVITETNAERAIEELRAYEADSATVLRDGRMQVVVASELVPGDVVEIVVGAKVPADLRLAVLLSPELRMDQSILTGESGSVLKDTNTVQLTKAVYQDKTNIAFSGTVVTAGRARGVVIGTGACTAIGRIRDAMAEAQEQDTPLKQKLDQFGALLSKGIAIICILVWVVNLPHFSDPLHGSWFGGALYYFKIAVALAVAAIPEGLPAVVTTCLALGTRQMAKRNAIVRRLPSVETLGCTTVICSDKTGTLTTNQMSVVRMAAVANAAGGLQEFTVSGTSYAPEGRIKDLSTNLEAAVPADMPALLHIAACSSLCNESHLTYNEERGIYERMGEATEVALRVLAEKIGLPGYQPMDSALVHLSRRDRATYCNDYWLQAHRKIFTLEFSRDRKRMSALCADEATGKLMLYCKGAPESVLERCTTALSNDGSGEVEMTPALRAALYNRLAEYGGQHALRCLALAVRPWTHGTDRQDVHPDDEMGFCFVGLVGMQDPPRPEVCSAIEECKAAGIRVIMVTGDNKATAESVSKQIGLLNANSGSSLLTDTSPFAPANAAHEVTALVPAENGETSVSGLEFEEYDAGAQAALVSSLAVLSRVEPQHKSRLVELLQSQGQVVAMTGDGVNDAPALKRADIGIAMGSGTAVAKHASDMVLADDNFATIVAAVAAGRSIYANTRQFIRYMVSSNIGEVVAIFSAALLGIPECLNPVQLLWVNLVTDGLPATAIGFNRPDGDIMRRPPRKASEGIVGRWMLMRYLVVGAYVGAVTAGGFIWWFLYFAGGPQLTWAQLRDFQHCTGSRTIGGADSVAASGRDNSNSNNNDAGTIGATGTGLDCSVFASRAPSTVSMSVLVIVEMFNALNALSENCSLLSLPPWSNPWLLGAIAVSVALHLLILYVPPLAVMFSVTALSWGEWKAVLWLSAPVILVDEALKFVSRRWILQNDSANNSHHGAGRGSSGGGQSMVSPARSFLLATLPGWHAARTALYRLRGGVSGKALSRKLSGEGLPLVSTESINHRRQAGLSPAASSS